MFTYLYKLNFSTNKMNQKETFKYEGWLNSDSFWKRLFSITGYSALGSLIVWMVLAIIFIFIGIVFPYE